MRVQARRTAKTHSKPWPLLPTADASRTGVGIGGKLLGGGWIAARGRARAVARGGLPHTLVQLCVGSSAARLEAIRRRRLPRRPWMARSALLGGGDFFGACAPARCLGARGLDGGWVSGHRVVGASAASPRSSAWRDRTCRVSSGVATASLSRCPRQTSTVDSSTVRSVAPSRRSVGATVRSVMFHRSSCFMFHVESRLKAKIKRLSMM